MKYQEFLKHKAFNDVTVGFTVKDGEINQQLFDYQRAITSWALARGRAAIFADTGLGKTAMQAEWARHVAEHECGKVLIVAPLCVAHQTVKEAGKFGVDVTYAREPIDAPITITNYEMLDRFDLSEYCGIVLDESSILKAHDGKTRTKIIELSQVVPYRLSCTATPSPNDFMELGNQAEFLGVMSRQGIPDYLVTMRKPGENPEPVTHTNESFPVAVWQRYASPVWMDINPNNTLNFRAARDNEDERHICPLQLDVIERAINLWTNPQDLVLSPFAGVGSEGYMAVQLGRRFVGVELKESYFGVAKQNLDAARRVQGDLLETA